MVSQSYGTIPDPAWKLRRYRQEWSQADTLNTAIGQGYVILNPLQLAIMAARVASGREVQPRLVLDRRPPAPPLPFAPASFEAVRSGMAEVVNGNGTAGASRLPLDGVQMAGKTGTAQVRNIMDASRGRAGAAWRYRDHGLFIFFAPVGAPRYAGAVVIEHGLGGARAAAPGRLRRDDLFVRQGQGDGALLAARGAMGRQHRRADGAARRRMGEPPARRRAASGAGLMAPRLPPQAGRRAALADAGAGDRHRRLQHARPLFGRRRADALGAAAGDALHGLLRHGDRYVRVRPEWIKQAAFPAYVIILLLLMVVEALGFVSGGAQRWLNLGFINLQPTELMKPVIVLAMRPFLRAAAGARDPGLERALAGRPA